MRQAIAHWYDPITEHDGYPNPVGPAELPQALREWYQLTGKRSDIWSKQDTWLRPWEIAIRHGHLTFFVENQGCAYWGIPLAHLSEIDPPVFVDFCSEGGWVRENTTVSEFALQMLAYCVKWSHQPFWANGSANALAVNLIRANYSLLAFPDWNWPILPTRFFGTRDLIAELNGEEDETWVWVTTRTPAAFEHFKAVVDPAKIQWAGESSLI